MGKRELYMALLCLLVYVNNSLAQSSACAYQRIELHIHSTIEMLMPDINTINAAARKGKDGSISGNQQLQINSNKRFIITINTDNSQPSSTAANTLSLNSKDDGHSQGTFPDNDSFTSKGYGEKMFAVNYNIRKPKKQPAENYSVGVVYTATEL